MKTVKVRLRAEIDDTMEVEVEDDANEQDAIDAANADWQFVEASSWSSEVVS